MQETLVRYARTNMPRHIYKQIPETLARCLKLHSHRLTVQTNLFFLSLNEAILRKCLETGDIRLLTKDQIAVFHIYVQTLMFNG